MSSTSGESDVDADNEDISVVEGEQQQGRALQSLDTAVSNEEDGSIGSMTPRAREHGEGNLPDQDEATFDGYGRIKGDAGLDDLNSDVPPSPLAESTASPEGSLSIPDDTPSIQVRRIVRVILHCLTFSGLFNLVPRKQFARFALLPFQTSSWSTPAIRAALLFSVIPFSSSVATCAVARVPRAALSAVFNYLDASAATRGIRHASASVGSSEVDEAQEDDRTAVLRGRETELWPYYMPVCGCVDRDRHI
jgi:hypothetical protein